MTTKITDDGQVTIPQPILDHLGGPGSQIDFKYTANGNIVIEKAGTVVPAPDRFEKLLGIAGPGPSTDEIMAELRGD